MVIPHSSYNIYYNFLFRTWKKIIKYDWEDIITLKVSNLSLPSAPDISAYGRQLWLIFTFHLCLSFIYTYLHICTHICTCVSLWTTTHSCKEAVRISPALMRFELSYFCSSHWFLRGILHSTTFSQYLMRIIHYFATITQKISLSTLVFRTASVSVIRIFAVLKLDVLPIFSCTLRWVRLVEEHEIQNLLIRSSWLIRT